MTEISTKTISMATVSMVVQTVESIVDNGSTIRWKVKAHLLGVTVVDMLDSTRMIKNMAKEHLSGQTAENILVIGTKENNTVWEFT